MTQVTLKSYRFYQVNEEEANPRTDSIQNKFSDHSEAKLEINNRKITRKSPYTYTLRNKLVNNHRVKEKIIMVIRKYFELNAIEYTTCQNLYNAAKDQA